MSVVQEFDVKAVRYSMDPKKVYMLVENGNKVFPFDIYCHMAQFATKFNFFFDLKSKKVLIAYQANSYGPDKFRCGLVNFWIEEDGPVLATHWLQNTDKILECIRHSFAEQFASIAIDELINS